MTDFTANTALATRDASGLLASLRSFFTGLAAGYKTYQVYSELDGMSDAQLTGLGLTRSDLPRVAVDQAFDRT